MKKKLHLLDKDSSSEDDMDIDLLINNAYKTRADKSQKLAELKAYLKSTYKPLKGKGLKFSKEKRLNYGVI